MNSPDPDPEELSDVPNLNPPDPDPEELSDVPNLNPPDPDPEELSDVPNLKPPELEVEELNAEEPEVPLADEPKAKKKQRKSKQIQQHFS